MAKLNIKGKLRRERTDKVSYYLAIVLAIILGLYFILFLGVFGLWLSAGAWVSGLFLTAFCSYVFYRTINRLIFKKLLGCMLLCILCTTPVFATSIIIHDQSIAQKLPNQKEVDCFKTLLGRSYNYTELVVWENQHLNFTNEKDSQRNDDPIKIYEYGKGRCGEFATLYAELCISQGYRCRIVDNVFNDHVFNEVLLPNGTWIRVDASLNDTSSRAIGYPMFFEREPTWSPPILSLAFENSSIMDVTSTYRSDGFDLFSPLVIVILFSLFAICIIAIAKFLILAPNTNKTNYNTAKVV